MHKTFKRIICFSICLVLLASLLGGCKSLGDYDAALVESKGKWYYAENGEIQEDQEGLVEIGDHLFYFENGELSDETTFCKYKKQEYYVENGLAQTNRNGEVTVDSEHFYVRDGILTQCHKDGHEFSGNDCRTASVCQECGWADESQRNHNWQGGSCTEAPYCSVCGVKGESPQGHDLVFDSCTEPSYCSRCNYKTDYIVGHTYENEICTRCGANQAEEVTLRIWASTEDQLEGGWLEEMEERFEAAHPEYEITWINEPCSEGDAGGNVTGDPTAAGDVYMFANDQLDSLIMANAVTQLGGDALEQVKNDNSPTMVDTVTYTDGHVYGFPMSSNTWFMYYNKKIFSEEDVKSLDTMLDKGVVAFPMTTGWYTGAFFFANGGKLFGDHGNDASAGIRFGGSNGGYEAALAMINLAQHPNFRNDESGLGCAGLKTGEIGAFFSGSWEAYSLKEALGDDLGAVQLPTMEIGGSQKQLKAFLGSKAVGVNPHSANPEVATEFAAFLASVEGQKLRYEMRGVIPAAQALVEDEAVKSDCVAVAEMNNTANCTVLQSVIPEMSQYWTPIGNFGTLVMNKEVNGENYESQVDLLMEALNNTD